MKNNPAIAQGRSSLLVSSEDQTTLQPEARSLRASTLSWTKLELNPTDISDLSSLKSDTTAILNAQGNGKIELAAQERTSKKFCPSPCTRTEVLYKTSFDKSCLSH